MADGRHSAPRGRSEKSSAAKKRALANEHRLVALGDALEGREGDARKPRRGRFSRRTRYAIIAGVTVIGLVVALVGGGYVYANYRFSQIKKIQVSGEVKPISGQPFNILSIGSDSRAGLSGAVAAQTGATTGQVSGQRSDVVKIIHVDPTQGTLSMLSIPRDTMTTLLANTALFGKFNRINVNFGNGPSLLAQTITANFGIPIANTIVVSFGGLINAAQAIGGVYLNFPFPAKDPYSGLNIHHAGCQLVTGFQALAVARSRHYYWYQNGTWNYDGTSDFGRIDRQNAFLRAMLSRAKGLYNPLTINSFLSKIPEGITLDSNFSLNELIGLALRFHSLNPSMIQTYTLPTVSGTAANVGDVLFVDQPAAQQMLVNIFGNQLIAPTNPPPNSALQTPMPPVVTTTTTTTTVKSTSTSTPKKHQTGATTTTTVNPSAQVPYFDPVPCTP
ncbi:MAG TPA: LCP family protein [Acidimicrobiales bacterium]|nr:LCP family protein [Acidimicrobiales bacterium]